MCKVLVITQCEGFTGKWLHLWLVIPKIGFHLGKGVYSPFLLIDGRYFLTDVLIDIFDAVIDLFFQVFQQMSFQSRVD